MSVEPFHYFLTVVSEGSITKAAEKLFISQPSLSQYIKRLESSLDIELFDRKSSPLKLTYAGQRYYEYARKSLRMEENIKRELLNIKGNQEGQLRLGIALWRAACLLPDIFPSFHEKYPGIRLELLEAAGDQLEAALISDEIDVAVMNTLTAPDSSVFTVEEIYNERILLAVPAGHPAIKETLMSPPESKGRPLLSLDILNHIPLISTRPGQHITHRVHSALLHAGIEPEILLETGNLTTAINLTAAGMGCAFVPEEGCQVCQHPGKVEYYAVSSPHLSWSFSAVYRRDLRLPILARLFVDHLKNSLGE